MLTYNNSLKKYSQQLRKNMTDVERLLWSKIRGKQLKGYQFYRQKPIGNFIVDFYCPRGNLIIELDGGQHYSEEGKIKDEDRDNYLEDIGLRVLRFSDREVFEEMDGVLEKIGSNLAMENPPLSPFIKGGGLENPPRSPFIKGGGLENPPLSPFIKGGGLSSKEMLSEHRTPITNNPAPSPQNPAPRTQHPESNTQHPEAFTLMEMMLVVSLFTVVMGIVYTALSLNDMSRQTIGAQIELYRKNKQAHNVISAELRRSSPAPAHLVIIDGVGLPDSLRFQIPVATDANYDIIWGADGVSGNWIEYSLQMNNLQRSNLDNGLTLVTGSERIIVSEIADLQFQPLISGGITSVVINTTAQKTARGRTFTSNSTSQVYPRNR